MLAHFAGTEQQRIADPQANTETVVLSDAQSVAKTVAKTDSQTHSCADDHRTDTVADVRRWFIS
jgi:hypothetical protein